MLFILENIQIVTKKPGADGKAISNQVQGTSLII